MIEVRMPPPAESLAGLYDRVSRRLYAYALSLTGDAARSEDAVQDAFVRLLQYAPGRDVKSLEGFLFTATRNVILDERRRRVVRDKAPAPLPLAQASGEPDEAASRALGQLPEEQREAVVLKIYADLTFAEIGEVTGTSLDTAAGRYRLGIEKLAQLLPRNET
jgi:RNA polymerase sigma-70 factor (ECF subfamily)